MSEAERAASDEADWINEMYASEPDVMAPEHDLQGNIVLYRPVGALELDLIRESGFSRFPPRLAQQPIFYPVLNREYATQIAQRWNTKDDASGHAGFVTRFAVDAGYMDSYQVHQVGGRIHCEYWIPAEQLAEFNDHIIGGIEVVSSFTQAASNE